MERVTGRVSTILISMGKRTHTFSSMDEVPPRLRKKLVESTQGLNSATILIADRGGREEILRSLQAGRSDLASRLLAGLIARRSAKPRPHPGPGRHYWRLWAELALVGAVGAVLWLLVTLR